MKKGGKDISKKAIPFHYASLSFGIRDPRSRGSAGSPTAYNTVRITEYSEKKGIVHYGLLRV